ncbi:MAG: hypothetical protein CMJ30_08265 [Phycisphaerae bacterium]|jgi:hypothetical protein|nr:hypothetical protein [Phycisphaerae bacterium]
MSEALCDETSTAALDDVETTLGELRREAKMRQTLPWLFSALVHGFVLLAGFWMTFLVIQDQDEVRPVSVRSDFEALTFAPVRLPTESLEVTPSASASLMSQAPILPGPQPVEPTSTAPVALASPVLTSQSITDRPDTASFFGVSGSDARRVVYCIDASGSMIRSLPMVLEHLGQSMDQLKPPQRFSVVFFQDNEAVPMPKFASMPLATLDHKRAVIRWMHQDIVPLGRSNPLRALELALSVNPDVIFLLSENITGAGPFEIEADRLLAALEDQNPIQSDGTRATAIKCIQFLEEDVLGVLRKIADAHGGPNGYNFVERDGAGRLQARQDGTDKEQGD